MANAKILWPCIGLLCVLLSCGKADRQPDLHVLSFAPAVRTDPSQLLRLQFSAPAVGPEAVGPQLAAPPIALDPPAAVTAHWADRQTLVVRADGLRTATRYQLTLQGELAQRSFDKRFSFIEAPLQVTGVRGFQLDAAPSTGFELSLDFNWPVRAGEAAARCALVGAGQPGALTAVKPIDIASSVTLRAPKLQPGSTYHLRCAEVMPATGDVPLQAPYDVTLTVAPAFTVVAATPAKGERVDPDEARLHLEFSTAVDGEALARAVHLQPPVRSLPDRWVLDDGTIHEAVLDLEPSTKYTLTIDRELRDSQGQMLAGEVSPTFAFQTGNGKPRMRLDRGIVTVEAGRPGALLWTRNLATAHLKCAAVPPEKAAAVLAGPGALVAQSWYGEDKDIDWTGLAVKELDLPIAGVLDHWHKEALDLTKLCGGTSRGVVLAEVTSEELARAKSHPWGEPARQRLLVNVTDIGMVVKTGPESGLVWAVGLHDGKPIAGADVRVFAADGSTTLRGRTDADGLLRLPGLAAMASAQEKKQALAPLEGSDRAVAGGEHMLFAAEKGGDFAVTAGNWRQGLEPWQFDVPFSWQAAASTLRGVLFTDRGVYRPGETAHFKGIVRNVTAKGMAVPEQRTVHVVIEDARDAPVLEKDVQLSEFGGFSLDCDFGEEAALGDWHVRAEIGETTLRQDFLVEEFRRRTFEVKVVAPATEPARRQPLPFAVEARYLFGAPVAHAQVSWQILKRNHDMAFDGYQGWNFGASAGEYRWEGEEGDSENLETAAEGTGTTDADGKLAFVVPPAREDGSGALDYVAVVEVIDSANDSVKGHATAVFFPSTVYVGLDAPWLAEAGKPVTVRAVALHPDGTPAASSAVLRLERDDWQCTGRQRAWSDDDDCREVHTQVLERIVSLAGAKTEVSITPPLPGSYRLHLTAKDAGGHEVAASSWLWVSGTGAAAWRGNDAVKMDLVASQKSFKAGDSARILARTALAGGTALLTMERSGVLQAQVKTLTGPAQPLDFAIVAEHAPNVLVSVVIAAGRTGPADKQRPRLQMGLLNLPVPASDRGLQVQVSTEREAYEPGEEVTATVRLMAGGEPVVGEVALSVADEGVLQLIGFKTPDPLAAMYAPWDLTVATASNWTRILRPSDPTVQDPDEGGDAAGAQGARKRFVSSAFWAADLRTGPDGTVTVHFPAPDNLTAFRVMAMAADAGARFGSADRRFTVKKPVQAQPVAPRFLVPGDQAELGVLVHNHTGAAGEATVRATATGMRLARTEAKVTVAAGGSARIAFAATALPGEKATLRFDVAIGQFRDAVVIEVPVVERLMIDRTVAGSGRTEATVEMPVKWPESGYVASASRLEVTIDRTGMAALEPALKALIAYPYGCLEQTLSRFVPLAKVKELAAVAGLDGLQGPALDRYLAAGAAKLLRFQDASGHFSLWPGGHGEPHYTVYAMQGVLEAQRAGVAIDKTLAAKGLKALQDWAAGQTTLGQGRDTVTLVIGAYVLAELGKADAGLNARLFAARAGLPRFGQAYLLRALLVAKGPAGQVKMLTEELTARVVIEGDRAHLQDRDKGQDDWWWPTDQSVRPTAALLQALLAAKADHPLLPKLAQHLLASTRNDGSWANTHDNAYAIMALASWARLQADGEAGVEIKLGDKTLAKQTLHGHEALKLALPLGGLQPGMLTVQARGSVCYLARVVVARRDDKALASAQGLSVARRYLDADSGKPVLDLKAGQLVRIELEIDTPQPRNDIALVDPLPAGLEAVNLRLQGGEATQAHSNSEDDWEGRWWTWQWTEQRDEEVRAFAGHIDAGKTTYRYLARALIAGTFTAAPATAEAMYEPEIHGRSAGIALGVK